MLTNEQFEELLALEHEVPSVECKGPGPRNDPYHLAKIARAVMGMTNRRDGGTVIIGVEERNGVLNPVGLSQTDIVSWRNNDHVIDAFASYMTPPASYERSIKEFQGKEFVVLEVHEFTDIPIICKKRFQRDHQSGHPDIVLREGTCYIRSRYKPETVEVTLSTEHMRELLDLAIEKGLRKFVTRAQRGGMSLSGIAQPDDVELFNEQLAGWESPLLEKIQSRGYWKVIIRPTRFIEERIPEIITLYPLLQNTSVDLRGWNFPHTTWDRQYQIDNDWVGQEYEWDWILESWRFYQSGQFTHISGIMDDWRDQSRWNPSVSEEWKPGTILSVEGAVYRFTEIFEFASRLALANEHVFDEKVRIEILISGLQGRQLYLNPARWLPLFDKYDTSVDTLPLPLELSKEDLIANPRELALQPAMKLFHRFRWNPSKEMLQDVQSKLGQI